MTRYLLLAVLGLTLQPLNAALEDDETQLCRFWGEVVKLGAFPSTEMIRAKAADYSTAIALEAHFPIRDRIVAAMDRLRTQMDINTTQGQEMGLKILEVLRYLKAYDTASLIARGMARRSSSVSGATLAAMDRRLSDPNFRRDYLQAALTYLDPPSERRIGNKDDFNRHWQIISDFLLSNEYVIPENPVGRIQAPPRR